MEHPFVANLDDKSLEDLQTTITSLHSKLTFAQRTQNSAMIQQINMVLESYRNAYQKKMDEMIKRQNLQNQVHITKK